VGSEFMPKASILFFLGYDYLMMSPLFFHLLAFPIGISLVVSRDLGWRWGIMSFAAWLLSGSALLFAYVIAPDCDVHVCTQGANTLHNAFYGLAIAYWVALIALALNIQSLFKTIVAILGLPAAIMFIDVLFMG
jgi:hypothetical protein